MKTNTSLLKRIHLRSTFYSAILLGIFQGVNAGTIASISCPFAYYNNDSLKAKNTSGNAGAEVQGTTEGNGAAAVPAWASNLSVGQWYEIPNTKMSGIEPSPVPPGNGPISKIIAWNSFAIDPRDSKVYSAANGGHNDYAGNEVDVLELELNAPRWVAKLGPTPSNQLTQCSSYYADGRPTSRHSYYGHVFVPHDNRIVLTGGAFWCLNGGFHRGMSSYNITTNTWNPSNTHPTISSSLGYGPATTVDPTTGDIYQFGNYDIFKWTRSSNTWSTRISDNALWGDEAMSAFDVTRGRILIAGGVGEHHIYTPSTNTLTEITFTGSGASAVLSANSGAMVYVPEIDRYLVRLAGSGGVVYQINPSTFAVTSFPTTGGGSIPATQNGPYNKFLYAPRLGGVVYVPTYGGNAWFLKTGTPAVTGLALNANQNNIVKGFPIPATNHLNIESPKAICRITITSVHGKIMEVIEFNKVNQTQLNLEMLSTGFYLITVEMEDRTVELKSIIKQ